MKNILCLHLAISLNELGCRMQNADTTNDDPIKNAVILMIAVIVYNFLSTPNEMIIIIMKCFVYLFNFPKIKCILLE